MVRQIWNIFGLLFLPENAFISPHTHEHIYTNRPREKKGTYHRRRSDNKFSCSLSFARTVEFSNIVKEGSESNNIATTASYNHNNNKKNEEVICATAPVNYSTPPDFPL